ncbi:MAG: methyltransferase domain-containing protein [Candidatus Omnitrophica bacterium]|nr:methyltransferase domain-containing protein [Candidatus Omnitrophota bacterium]
MISIILPLKNEEKIVNKSLTDIFKIIKKHQIKEVEVLCIINDTNDNTEKEIKKFIKEKKSNQIRIIQSKPGYGNALLKGIEKSNGEIIVIFNADLINEDILIFAKNKLLNYDLVIGSKNITYSIDTRPLIRKLITKIFNLLLKIFFNYKGSDTHGIKALKKKTLVELINLIKKKNIFISDIIDTLIVLLFEINNKKILEIPIEVKEERPSRFKKRFFYFWRDLYLLIKSHIVIKNQLKKYFYDSINENWPKILNKKEFKKRFDLIFNSLLKNYDFKNKKVLDAGCGLGLITNELIKRKSDVYGIDISKKSVEYLKNKFNSEKFMFSSVAKLPFKNDFFDLVIFTEVLEHIEKKDQLTALRELYRVLKPKGFLVLTTPNLLWRPFFKFLEIIKIRPYHGIENWYRIKKLKKTIESLGFRIIEERHFNFLYPTKILDYFEKFKFLSCFMINQGYLLQKIKKTK